MWAGRLQAVEARKILFVTATVRIDNSLTLETQAKGQDSNPEPKSLRDWGQRGCLLRFLGVKTLQAEAKNDGPDDETSQTTGIITPNGGVIKAPNRGNKIPTINFMSLKSTAAINQESPPGEGIGPKPHPMTTALEKENQVVNLRFFTNE
ncbi:hypothetical protein DSO57_1014803 [Entomophthora muscae]|uniref:Uncharacterized protein n=1 Tax=Entomophthora muscae TaxID=34485 RepID=A0ACC2UQQ5_9FUNG|nr:hypothetical protein DSO57_1014803 [Entomophthora muscae]